MAIPFFMLAGELMNRGGITHRLVEFSQAMMGHLKGGLAHVNVLTSMLFAGLSGSAVADTSAIGSMLIPAMKKSKNTELYAIASRDISKAEDFCHKFAITKAYVDYKKLIIIICNIEIIW